MPVKVIRLSKNMGVTTARNSGVRVSTCDWIAFLDSDDWFLPEKLELQRRCALENEHAVLIYTGVREIAIDGSEAASRFVSPGELWPMLRYLSGIDGGSSAVALRREAFESVGGFDPSLRVCEDWDLWLRLALRYSVKTFACVPKVLAVYRRVPESNGSNAMRYFHARSQMLEKVCLQGTAGPSRLLWRHCISAYQYYTTSIALREEGSPLDLKFVLKSIALWPLPWREMSAKRYKVAAVMAIRHLLG